MKIRAAVVKEQSGPFLLEELETDNLRDDEILVRITGAGICHTDLICRDQVYPVPLPCVFGHEGSGVVEQTGSAVKKVVAGDHVVLSFRSCGQCPACLKGDLTHCINIFPVISRVLGMTEQQHSMVIPARYMAVFFHSHHLPIMPSALKPIPSRCVTIYHLSCLAHWVAGYRQGLAQS